MTVLKSSIVCNSIIYDGVIICEEENS